MRRAAAAEEVVKHRGNKTSEVSVLPSSRTDCAVHCFGDEDVESVHWNAVCSQELSGVVCIDIFYRDGSFGIRAYQKGGS